MEVIASLVWQDAPLAQTVGFVHRMSVHVPRWPPVDGGPALIGAMLYAVVVWAGMQ